MPQRYKLTVSADLEEIRQIGAWIRSNVSRVLSEVDVDALMPTVELVVQELAVNIVEHGYDATGDERVDDKRIDVELATSKDKVEVTVMDQGRAYDPEAIAVPDIEDLQVSGYGVMIIKKLTSEFAVEHVGGRNISRLRFDVPTASE